MNIKNVEVFNLEGALRGMRNPLESWEKSDSGYCLPNMCHECENKCGCENNDNVDWTPYKIGNNDLDLAKRLIVGGSEHRKFLRQIFVSADFTLPLYIYKELDTYKIGTTSNSTSTMHKIASKPITFDCFEMDDFVDYEVHSCRTGEARMWSKALQDQVDTLENLRQRYIATKDPIYWKELIRWLPESWLQTRTITMNYEVLRTIYFQRKNHKLVEWHRICDWIESLPYSKDLITLEEKNV